MIPERIGATRRGRDGIARPVSARARGLLRPVALALVLTAGAGLAPVATAQAPAGDAVPPDPLNPTGRPVSMHQDSPRLTHIVSGLLPPDGLVTLGLRGRRG